MSDNNNDSNKECQSNNNNNNTEEPVNPDNQLIIDEIYRALNQDNILMEMSDEESDKLRATLKVSVRTAWLLLRQVFNKNYYPLMSELQERILMTYFVIHTVLNVVYPYTKEGSKLHKLINNYRKSMIDFCVESCLLYVLDERSEVFNMIAYLSELFYQLY